MRAGRLRYRITIQTPDDAASVMNGTRSWSTYATVWADIVPMSGAERYDSDTKKSESEITHTIKMRFIRGVRPNMRATYDGRIFNFTAPIDVNERKREMSISAYEETDV